MSIKLRTEHLNDDARLNKAGLVVNDGILYTRHLILRLMCGAYIIAFSAFYYQSRGKNERISLTNSIKNR